MRGRLGRHLASTVVTASLGLAGFSAAFATAPAVVGAGIAPVPAEASPPFIPTDADWLTTVNYYREMAGLNPVTEDPALSAGSYLHSCYMLQNGISHEETPGKPGYTAEGQQAGTHGNVAVTSVFNERARSHIELWMTGPFHAIGILRPNLETVGFGKCDDQSTPKWHSAATLDVLRGLGTATKLAAPIVWPGNGTTTSLTRFIVESPDPLPYCGWSGTAGLPLIALLPEAPSGTVTAQVTGPAGPIETCALTSKNTDGVASAILAGNNVVIAVPRTPLTAGVHTATITTGTRTITWSFTVDPAAANGATVAPNAAPSSPSVAFQPVTPVRLADTRETFGASRIVGQVSKRIQITGRGVVPAGASAISANFTVSDTAGAGYLTVWNCSADRPVVATLNFNARDTVPNGATVPLDATGGICVYSPVGTELVVDVNGYYSPAGVGRFTQLQPVRLMDTRTGLGGSTRLRAGETVALQVGAANGIPADAAAVTLNVASVDPLTAGYVTVYPCDSARPFTASLNPVPGRVKPNLVITPLADDGTVCFYTLRDVDLVVDATGYLSTTSTSAFTATVPFRFTDTRDKYRPEVNGGTVGRSLAAGQTLELQVAGQRGIPSGVTAVSVNIAVTDATIPGFITVYPCGQRPTTANVNYEVGEPISNGAQVPLSSDGRLCVYTYSPAHVIIDVNGWWS